MKNLGKRTLSALMALLLVASFAITAPARAANPVPLSVTASKTSVNVGETITFTARLGSCAGTNLASLQFDFDLPAGLTFVSSSVNSSFASTVGFAGNTFTDGTLRYAAYGGAGYNGTGTINIVTITCTATATGSKTVTLKSVTVGDKDSGVLTSSVTAVPAVAVNQPLTNVDVALTTPVLSAIPVPTVSGTGYTGTVTWNGNPSTFAPSTTYTATVTLTAEPDYVFNITNNTNIKVNGVAVTSVPTKNATTIIFTKTFPATAAKTNVSSSITFDPSTVDYDGTQKPLSASSTDGSGGTFTYSYVGTGGTTYAASQTAPTNAGTYNVTATYNSPTATGTKTALLTISKPALTITGITAVDRAYNGNTTVQLTGTPVLSGSPAGVGVTIGNGTVSSADADANPKPVTTNITLTGANSGNYTLTQPTGLTVTISKADATYSVPATQDIKVGSGLSAISAPANATGVGGATVAGNIAWFTDNGRTIPAQNTDLNGLAVTATKTLYWRFTPTSNNYNIKEGATDFTIVEGDPQTITFPSGSQTKTYGNAVFTYAATRSVGTGEVTYESSDETVATVTNTGAVTIHKAGTTTIKAIAAAVPGAWAKAEASYVLTVNKAAQAALTVNSVSAKTYGDGDVTLSTSGGSGNGAVTYTVVSGLGSVTGNTLTITGAGNIVVKAAKAFDDNYNAIESANLSIIVNRKAPVVGDLDFTIPTPTYDGQPHSVAVTAQGGVTGLGTITVKYTGSATAPTNAGTYAVTADIAVGANYAAASNIALGSLVISQATPVTPTVTGTLTNDGQVYTYTITAPATGAQYKIDSEAWQTSKVFTGIAPDSSHTFSAQLLETVNYVQSAVGVTGTVSFPKLTPAAPTLAYTVTGDFPTKTVTITSVAGAEYNFGSGYGTTNTYTSTSAETLTLSIKLTATGTHNESPAATVTINTANLDQTAPGAFALQVTANGETDYTVTIPEVADAEYSFDGTSFSTTRTTTANPGDTVTGYVRIAATTGYNASNAVSNSVTLPLFQVKTPTAAPNDGTFATTQSVTLASATTSAEIYYTTDNSDPALSGVLYSGPFTLDATATVKAIALKSGMADSAVLTVTFTKSSGGGGGGSATPETPTPPPSSITVTTPEGSDPVVGADGTTTLPGGGTVTTESGAEITLPGGTTIAPDGKVTVGKGGATVTTSGGFTFTIEEDSVIIFDDDTPLGFFVEFDTPFTDVKSGDWFYDDVAFVYGYGLFKGTSATTFSPNLPMTRAMWITVLARLDGQDTDGGATWYEKALAWGVAQGITDGTNPDGNITREQLITILYRYVGSPAVTGTLAAFPDADAVSDYAKDALAWAISAGIIKGDDKGNINPQGYATRAEVAAILHRFVEKAK
jgi:hypothetical protein